MPLWTSLKHTELSGLDNYSVGMTTPSPAMEELAAQLVEKQRASNSPVAVLLQTAPS